MLSNICTLRHLLLGKDFISSNLTSPVFGYIPAICPEPLDVELALAFHWVSMSEKQDPEKAEPPRCKYCGTTEAPIFVRAHMECPKCHTVTESCCDGGRCG